MSFEGVSGPLGSFGIGVGKFPAYHLTEERRTSNQRHEFLSVFHQLQEHKQRKQRQSLRETR